jgi:hypothetical protein
MSWVAHAGATLLVPSGPAGHHLFIVLNEPAEFEGYGTGVCVVMVSFSSQKPGRPHDATCECAVGEHPFIKKPSFIDYSHLRVERVTNLAARVATGFFVSQAEVDPQLLARILAGVQQSRFSKREFKHLLA